MSCIGLPSNACSGTFAKSVVGFSGVDGWVTTGDDILEEAGLVGVIVEGEVMSADKVG